MSNGEDTAVELGTHQYLEHMPCGDVGLWWLIKTMDDKVHAASSSLLLLLMRSNQPMQASLVQSSFHLAHR